MIEWIDDGYVGLMAIDYSYPPPFPKRKSGLFEFTLIDEIVVIAMGYINGCGKRVKIA
jgi:hypothetical protein